MKEHTTRRLSRPLIAGHGRDGRCLYDQEAKRELVRICLQPGMSRLLKQDITRLD